jgi:hypothetical protein
MGREIVHMNPADEPVAEAVFATLNGFLNAASRSVNRGGTKN